MIIKTNKKTLLSLTLLVFIFITACNNTELFSKYSFAGISSGGQYVAFYQQARPEAVKAPYLPEYIDVRYEAGAQKPEIYLNGQNISASFTFEASSAKAKFSDVADFIKQGKNELSLKPQNIGSNLSFYFTNQGPSIAINRIDNLMGDGSVYDVYLALKSRAKITSVSLQRMDYQWDGDKDANYPDFNSAKQTLLGSPISFRLMGSGLWQNSSAIDAAPLYKISATDSYGYTSESYYLAPDQKLNNYFRLRLNANILPMVSPMALSSMKNVHLYAPKEMAFRGQTPDGEDAKASSMLDTLSQWWTSDGIFYSNVGAAVGTERVYNAGGVFYYEAGSDAYCGYANTETQNLQLDNSDFICPSDKIKREVGGLGIGHTGNYYCSLKDIQYKKDPSLIKPGYCSRIYMTEVKIKDADKMAISLDQQNDNRLHLETKVNDLKIRMGIRNIACGFAVKDFRSRYSFPDTYRDYGIAVNKDTGIPLDELTYNGKAKGGFCQDIGWASYLGVGLGDMKINASYSDVKGDIDINIKNGQMNLAVVDGFDLGLSSDLTIGNSGIDWILGALSSVLNNMFVDIVEDTLKQNMQDFILGFDLCLVTDDCSHENNADNDPSMQMQAQAYQVFTNTDNAVQWNMFYSGFLKNLKTPLNVNATLGSLYTATPLLPLTDPSSDIDLALNINAINQALTAMHLSGVTHITVTNRPVNGTNVFFGADFAQQFTPQLGDLRVQLIPMAPAELVMRQGQHGTQATLSERNALMTIDRADSRGQWKRHLAVSVDVIMGVLMTANNNNLQLSLLGKPQFEINRLHFKDENGWSYENDWLHISITGNFVEKIAQVGIDMLIKFAISKIADQVANWDYPLIPIPETDKSLYISTKKIGANHGEHLNFALALCIADKNKQCIESP